ncbi:MAG: Ig-like domain-containing protein [Candidatus Poribacteria bacterium]|nr:Ig-like domain-containing protein [Candidatus Poribacteria bacterium]
MTSVRASNTVLAQQRTTTPKVERTIPDLSEKVPTDLKEIKVIFNEEMTGVDIGYCGVPVGDVRWENNTTHVILFNEHLSPSKTYRLIFGRNEGYQNMAGVVLEEYVLTFTTEGPDPATPTFVDTTPVHVTDIEKLDLSDKLLCRVSESPTEGFNFPYYLLIPQGINLNKPIYLLVEPNNTGVGSNFVSLDRNTKDSIETCSASSVARKLKIPLLMPVFPRPGGTLYTHALDRETLLIKDGDLKRIDLQLIVMIAHAQKLMCHNNVKVNEKVFMNGFSASGTFTNRFAILHPTVVRAVATGGINCIPTFPTDQWNGTTMRYPVGIADVKEIAGIDFDEAAYKKVSQYIYMGALDDNDTVPYRDAYDEVDAELVKSLIGAKMMPDRWDTSQSIYRALGIPVQFVTYENTGHETKREMHDDIAAFFEANIGDEIVEIVPHQYPSQE